MSINEYFPATLGARANAQGGQKSQNANTLLNAFLVLHIIPSHFGLPLLVITFLFSKGAKRHPTLINVCISWILTGIFSTLLLYAGQATGPEPNKALCRLQTSMLYGTLTMCPVAIFTLVYYVWTFYDSRRGQPSAIVMNILIAAPYVTLVIWALAVGVLALHNPEKVDRNRRFFYCSLDLHPLSNTMSIFIVIICLATAVLEVRIAIMLYRNWRGLKEAGESGGISVQFVIRLLIFGIYIFMSVFFSLATMWDPQSPVPDIYAATIGLAVMLVFGSQPDIWRTWCFWRTRRPQRVINLSQEPSYTKRELDLDKKVDVDPDDDVLDICRPTPDHASHSAV